MDRLTRLYAVAETLRAAAPRLVSVSDLARRHGVSTRTIQRDLQALMASGLPVRWEDGRGGGWTVDPTMTLPPVNLTADEAAAVLLAVHGACGAAPMSGAAASALRKIEAVVGTDGSRALARWRTRVAVARPTDDPVRTTIEEAVADLRLVTLNYRDREGGATERDVEPVGLLTARGAWYLVAWCRLRRAPRAFRLDRIDEAKLHPTERVSPRDLQSILAAEGPALLPPGAV